MAEDLDLHLASMARDEMGMHRVWVERLACRRRARPVPVGGAVQVVSFCFCELGFMVMIADLRATYMLPRISLWG